MTAVEISPASGVLPRGEVAAFHPMIAVIDRLNEVGNAVDAARVCMTRDIHHRGADITGEAAVRARRAVSRVLEVGRRD